MSARRPTKAAAVAVLSFLSLLGGAPVDGWGRSGGELYSLLGVPRDASVAQIKKAYRNKARETHPDKNPNQDPEQAAEAFRKVVDAYSVLSDEQSRKRYDQTGKTTEDRDGGGGARGNQGPSWSWNFGNFHFQHQSRQQQWANQMKAKVKDAQSRVVSIVSMIQLDTMSLDDNGRLERNLLIAFCSPKSEKVLDETVLYPYPFAGMSDQGIWWEDILLAGKVRYNSKSEVAKHFGVGDVSRTPSYVFLRRGATLEEFQSLSTASHEDFKAWMWKMVEVHVSFVNNHTAPVRLYWIHGNRANIVSVIPPGHSLAQNTMFSHEWYAMDDRAQGNSLTKEIALMSWKVLSDTVTTVYIQSRDCMDWHGSCAQWARGRGECRRNPTYMLANCRNSCDVCRDGGPLNPNDIPPPEPDNAAKDEL